MPQWPDIQDLGDYYYFSSVQSLSCIWLFVTPWIAARQASLSITNSQSSLRLTSIDSVMPSSHLILCRSLLLLPTIPPSISLFQWVNSSHEVANVLEFQLFLFFFWLTTCFNLILFSNFTILYWFCNISKWISFSIISSKEIPGLISFRMDWLDLFAV